MLNCCVPGCTCTNYSSKTRKAADKQLRKTYAVCAIQLCLQCPFLPSCFKVNTHLQIMGQKCKCRLKVDAVQSQYDYSHEPKKKKRLSSENALNNEDMKKLVFYNIG